MSEEKREIGLILGESVEDFGHRIKVLGLHEETMKRVVMIAKLKFMKTNSEYSEKAELWESSQNSSSNGAPRRKKKLSKNTLLPKIGCLRPERSYF